MKESIYLSQGARSATKGWAGTGTALGARLPIKEVFQLQYLILV